MNISTLRDIVNGMLEEMKSISCHSNIGTAGYFDDGIYLLDLEDVRAIKRKLLLLEGMIYDASLNIHNELACIKASIYDINIKVKDFERMVKQFSVRHNQDQRE